MTQLNLLLQKSPLTTELNVEVEKLLITTKVKARLGKFFNGTSRYSNSCLGLNFSMNWKHPNSISIFFNRWLADDSQSRFSWASRSLPRLLPSCSYPGASLASTRGSFDVSDWSWHPEEERGKNDLLFLMFITGPVTFIHMMMSIEPTL